MDKIAFVLMTCNDLKYQSIVSQLDAIEEVQETTHLIRPYDIIATIKADQKNIVDVITWKIRKIEDIDSTLTLLENQQDQK